MFHLSQFDGPLDLLLALITRAKLDIHDVMLAEITDQFIGIVFASDELQAEAASEFVAVAALLVEIKTRALLPRPPKTEDEGEESPEEMLIRRLAEYKRYKEACEELRLEESRAGMLRFKMPEERPAPMEELNMDGVTLAIIRDAFMRLLARTSDDAPKEPRVRQIERERYTVSDAVTRISRLLLGGRTARFNELLADAPTREEIVTVFLAVLELIKLARVRVFQREPLGELELKAEGGEADGGS